MVYRVPWGLKSYLRLLWPSALSCKPPPKNSPPHPLAFCATLDTLVLQECLKLVLALGPVTLFSAWNYAYLPKVAIYRTTLT